MLRQYEHSVTRLAVAAATAANLYLCRDALLLKLTGYANSMHGFWMALARAPLADWLFPTWWPWWDGGMPMEYTYAPLMPSIAGVIARLATLDVSHAWQIVTVLVFALGPAAICWSARRLGTPPAYALLGALFYSLTAPTELFAPDASFGWSNFWNARRMYLSFVWDETPHLAALALLPLALVTWVRLLDAPGPARRLAAVLATAAPVLANTFGATQLAMALACLIAARPGDWRAILSRVVPVALLAYLVVSPWLPPSLIGVMMRNSNAYPEGAVAGESAMGIVALAAAFIPLAWLLSRMIASWAARFWLLMAFAACTTVAMFHHLGWRLVPQAGRYRSEAEVALAMTVAFVGPMLARRLPALARAALAAGLLYLAWGQVASHRQFARGLLRSVDPNAMVESRVAGRLHEMKLSRVFVPGSIAAWMNAFAPVAQLGGGSFPTAINLAQQQAVEAIYGRGAGDPVARLRTFGAAAVVVTGPGSREFWKPFPKPDMYEGKLPLLWADADVRVYDTGVRSLARAGGREAVFRWEGGSRAVVEAETAPGEAIAVRINYHRGWNVANHGIPIAPRADERGLMVLDPGPGRHRIELNFRGGWEAWSTRAAAALALLLLTAQAAVSVRRAASR